jgi:derlin-1
MSELQQWWDSLPRVTKVLFAGSFGFTLAAGFGILKPGWLILDFQAIYRNFEIWRLVTPFMYHGGLGFPFLISMMWLLTYGGKLEQETFANDTADYLFFVLFISGTLFIPAFFLNLYILGKSLILAIIYYWSRKNPEVQMSYLFGIRFKAIYFPWVLVAFNVVMGGTPILEVIGILVGHLYFFLKDVMPAQSGRDLLVTPGFLKYYFPNPNAAPPRPGQGPRQAGYHWGRGNALQ